MTRTHRSKLATAAGLTLALAASGCGSTVAGSSRSVAAGTEQAGGSLDAPGAGGAAGGGTVAGTGSKGTSSAAGSAGTAGAAKAGTAASQGGSKSSAGTAGKAAAGAGSGPAPALAATGRGWDAKNVYIGVITTKDQQSAMSSAGAKGLNPGDNVAQANAVANYYNKSGGLFGRKVVIVIDDHHTASVLSNPDAESQTACSKFTQDRSVIAVVNPTGPLDTSNLRSCLARAGVPLFTASGNPTTDNTLAQQNGLFFPTMFPTWNKFAPAFVGRLTALKYFTPWKTSSLPGSKPGPVKVGIWTSDSSEAQAASKILVDALSRAGHPAQVFSYHNYATDAAPVELKMSQAHITHVIGMDAFLFTFAAAANSQQYFPRYGVHSDNGLVAGMQTNAPAKENVGAVGVGFVPSLDTNDFATTKTPGGQLCGQIMAANKQTFAGQGLAESYAYGICDALRLVADGAKAGGGFATASLVNGIGKIGAGFKPAETFSSALRAGYPALPGAGRDVAWQTSCSCYRYAGAPHSF